MKVREQNEKKQNERLDCNSMCLSFDVFPILLMPNNQPTQLNEISVFKNNNWTKFSQESLHILKMKLQNQG